MVTITVKKILLLPVVVAMISVMFFSIQTVTAAGPLDLTGVGNFAILANTYTNSAGGITLNGDLGYDVNASPGNSPTVTGVIFASSTPTYLSAKAVQSNLLASANNPAQTGSCTTTRAGVTVLDDLPQPLTPGVYCIDGSAHVNTAGIVLSGDGLYIFRINGALDTVANSHVTLAGAQADNVFWVPTGGTTLGANSVFAGNILTNAATTLLSTVSMNGRILSGGAVTTTGPNDTITAPLFTVTTPLVTTTPPVAITPLAPSLSAQNGAVMTAPTLGFNSDGTSQTTQVFTYNGNTDTSIFSSSYVVIAPKVGVVNKAVFKIYEKAGPGEIRHIDLAFGVATGQIFSDSRIMIQWDKSWNGVEKINVVDPEHSLTNVRVETSRGTCDAGVVRNDCLVVVLYHTFTAPLEFNAIATNVSDRISSLSYWSGYDRNDLFEFGQLKKEQVLIAMKLFDSSKIQTHMPVITDSVQYLAVDDRDTMKFSQMKVIQGLLATGLWDSSEIQNHEFGITAVPYVDNRDTLKFAQMKKDQAMIATEFWDSSEIQNGATP
ncbi:MAG TPA: ice-binding family protein, partial [Candidatus Nitrosotenuis sp.]